MKKVVLAVLGVIFPFYLADAIQTVSSPLQEAAPVLNIRQADTANPLYEASTGYSSDTGEIGLPDLEYRLWDMGEVWDEGSLLDLITVTPPDTTIQEGLLWRSYGLLGVGSRWHQEVHSAIEVKNVLAQNEIITRLINEGASLIAGNTGYEVTDVKVVDLSGTPGFSSKGVMFTLGSSGWQDNWENQVIVLPHFDLSNGVYLEVVTIGTHSQQKEAVSLAEGIITDIKNVFSGVVSKAGAEVSDEWQDVLKAVLFPDKEDLNADDTTFYESVKQEWLNSGLSDDKIKDNLNQMLVFLPFVYKQVFYSPLADAYLYEFNGRDSSSDTNYRKMLYDSALSLVREKNGLELDRLLLGGVKKETLHIHRLQTG